MLSAQLDTEFTADHYDGIKKVYSIWLCLDSPDYLADTITEYSITPKNLVGEFKGKARYDLLSAIVICLNKKSYLKKKSHLHGLLGTIFSEELKPEEKARILDREYDIKTEVEVKEGMGKMCNLSDAIEERGMEKKLIELVCRKIRKGKTITTISEELEEDESTIAHIYETALSAAPDYEWEKVYASLHGE